MNIKAFIADVIKSSAWPVTVLVLFLTLRKPILDLFKYIARIKYKDLEIDIERQLEKVREDIPKDELDKAKRTKPDHEAEVLRLAKAAPAEAVLDTWKQTEKFIYERLKALYPKGSPQAARLDPQRAYYNLLLSGALSPKAEAVLEKLYLFKDGVQRGRAQEVTTEIAIQYYDLCKYIQQKVSSLTELPLFKLTALTYLILELNAMIDTGKYQDITIEEVKREIEKGTVLEYVAERGGTDIDLSLITKAETWPNFRSFYIEHLQSIYNAYSGNERRKWGVQNSGLCLLLAWTNEIIQQGSGWHSS